ncbi:alpha/beta hydrolase [Buchananella felis]|uniref:alpha/beta hydrolase n=1 Tax=Buchananella felis TaxID=3231492 RepID=UPI003526FF46
MNAKKPNVLLTLAVVSALLGATSVGVAGYKLATFDAASAGEQPGKTAPSGDASKSPDADQTTEPGEELRFAANPRPADMPAAPTGLEQFYGQEIQWEECEDGAGGNWACGTVEVPLDYSKPDGETIEIALKRHKAEDPIGSLLVNFGGPGGSGTHNIEGALDYSFTTDLADAYDIVGFDPRGVHRSAPIKCRTFEQIDEDNAATAPFVRGKEAWDEIAASGKEFADLCMENTDVELLKNINTVSTASDVDILRDALNDAELYYLGYSYGTHLGARYAEMFPANAGRLVLDAAVDPALSSAELAVGQAKGFEMSVREYIRVCQEDSDCPFKGSVDEGARQLKAFFDKTVTNPLPTADKERPLTGGMLVSVVLGSMYMTDIWPMLTEGMRAAIEKNDGSSLLVLLDLLNERDSDGSYPTNSDDAFPVISAMDYPVGTSDTAVWEKQADEILAAAPTVGEYFLYSDADRSAWPLEATGKLGKVRAAGAKPILVIGGKGDPATPYEWSVSLADQLESGVLLTYDGFGHGAYGEDKPCVADTVDAFLIEGKVPEDGKVCK